MYDHSSAREQKWFIRLLLKNMKIGITKQQVFSVLHNNALEFYNSCSDLLKTCIAAENDEILVAGCVALFHPIRPMLCKVLQMASLYDLLGSDVLYIETKMDGERFHIHMANETYKYISRNGTDYTQCFGKYCSNGNLTPFFGMLFQIPVDNIILDGEMMVWNKAEGRFCVKGENHDVKHLPVGGNLRPCFVAYDLLYLNGESMMDMAYVVRTQKLREVIKESAGILQIVNATKLCTLSHFKDIFNSALDDYEEGVVIKKQKSHYVPASRKDGWYKVKPDVRNFYF